MTGKAARCVIGLLGFLCIESVGVAGEPRFRLYFSVPSRVDAPENTTQFFGATCELETLSIPTGQSGAQGWTLSVRSEGCAIAGATTAGTVAAAVKDDPPGLRDKGFELTEITTGPGNDGVVSAVALCLVEDCTLDPAKSPHDLLALTLAVDFPSASENCDACSLRYEDGLQGSGQPVRNRIGQNDRDVAPVVEDSTIEICSYVCPENGDSHVESLSVEPPEGPPGLFRVSAVAFDETEDPLTYAFRAESNAISLSPVSQETSTATFDLPDGSWQICATVDDDPLCPDEAPDSTRCVSVLVGGRQLPGDCDQSGGLNINDAICLLGYLFRGTPSRLPCGDTGTHQDPSNIQLADWNSDGAVTLTDGIAELSWLFRTGNPHSLAVPGMEGDSCIILPGCPDNPNCR